MIGERVAIGTGASVLGPVTIGADSVIGAAAVVVRHAPASSLLVGAPAIARPRSGVPGASGDRGIMPEEWFFSI